MTTGLSTPRINSFRLCRQPHNALFTPDAYPPAVCAPYDRAMKTVETLLNDQLAACLAAMQDCLNHSRTPLEDDAYGETRRDDVATMAKLMKASARLTEALARLKGQTSVNIRVTRERAGESRSAHDDVDKGGGG